MSRTEAFILWLLSSLAIALEARFDTTCTQHDVFCSHFLAANCSCEVLHKKAKVSCSQRSHQVLVETIDPSPLNICPIVEWQIRDAINVEIPWMLVSSHKNALVHLKLTRSTVACSCKNAWLMLQEQMNSSIIHDVDSLCPNCSFHLSLWTYIGLPPRVTIDDVILDAIYMQTKYNCSLDYCDLPELHIETSASGGECRLESKSSEDCMQTNVLPYYDHLSINESRLRDEVSYDSRHCSKSASWNVSNLNVVDSGWVECAINSPNIPIVKYVDALKRPPTPAVIRWKEECSLPGYFAVDLTIVGRPVPVLHWFRIQKHRAQPLQIQPTIVRNIHSPINQSSRVIFFADPYYANGFEGGWSVVSGRLKFRGPDKYCTAGNYLLVACPKLWSDSLALLTDENSRDCFLQAFNVCTDGESEACSEFVRTRLPAKSEESLSTPKSFSVLWIFGLLMAGVLCFVACLFVVVFYHKVMKRGGESFMRQESITQLGRFRGDQEIIPLRETNTHYVTTAASLKLESVTFINESELMALRPLGEGAFGEVLLVKYTPCGPEAKGFTSGMYLAMKQLKYVTCEKLGEVEREAGMLKALNHPNIVKFYGMCSKETGFALLFEYMQHGDLVKFLRAHNPDLDPSNQTLSCEDLLRISLQVANGLQYLHSLHLVHRDLAARNCLVNEDMTVKLSDFGMTRDIYVSDYYKVGTEALVPLRWLPPESMLYRKFTPESDVWSFGILLWEIFSYGQVPWYQYSNSEVLEVVKEGRHMKKPSPCPDYIYKQMMLKCWHMNAMQRPTARQVKDKLENILESTVRYTTLVDAKTSMSIVPRIRRSYDRSQDERKLSQHSLALN